MLHERKGYGESRLSAGREFSRRFAIAVDFVRRRRCTDTGCVQANASNSLSHTVLEKRASIFSCSIGNVIRDTRIRLILGKPRAPYSFHRLSSVASWSFDENGHSPFVSFGSISVRRRFSLIAKTTPETFSGREDAVLRPKELGSQLS